MAELSEDFFERRDLLLGGGATFLKEDPAVTKAALQRETGQNVDDEAVAASLEDPALIAHMQMSRQRYQESITSLTKVKKESVVRADLATVMGKLTKLYTDTEEPASVHATAADEIHIVGRHVGTLPLGAPVQPHFPKPVAPAVCRDPTFAEVTAKVQTLLQARADDLRKHDKYFKQHRLELSKARIGVVKVVDDLLEICEAQRNTIASQRELLAAASTVYNENETAQRRRRAEVLSFLNSRKPPARNAKIPKVSAVDEAAPVAVGETDSAAPSEEKVNPE